MQYQSFRGADLREALGQVKATLGPNALIENTRQVTNGQAGGLQRSYVEVTAAAPAGIEWPFASRAASKPTLSTPAANLRASAAARPQGRGGAGFSLLGQPGAELEKELTSLRAMVEELNANLPPRERATALLHSVGIEGAFARELVSGAARSAKKGREALKAWLASRVRERVTVREGLLTEPGPTIIVCVGPTGVGKTTTLAKMAARARLDLGRSVSVLSLDTFRVGAVEQWQRYATLMGVPFHVASDSAQATRVVRENRSDLLLIDTAGRTSRSTGPGPLEAIMNLRGPRVEVMLVVPAWLRASDAERMALTYADPAPTSVVVTKLDETVQMGGALHAALPRRLPLAYLCNGPRVPEDIQDASVDAVLSALFPTDT